ncbi:unnamed protein product, partial [Gadus morhua 'NCC']
MQGGSNPVHRAQLSPGPVCCRRVFQNYLSSMLDCPPTCTCSSSEIYCNKSNEEKFFPLLSSPSTGTNGNTTGLNDDLCQNISS